MKTCEYLLRDNNRTVIKAFRSVVSPEHREYREHHHTECELSVFLEGCGIYKVGNREYTFNKGDVFLFGSNEVHCITDIKEKIELLNIHFEPRILWENVELLKLFFARREGFNKFENENTVAEFILKCEEELKNKLPCYEINARYSVLSALVYTLRKYNCTDDGYRLSVEKSHITVIKRVLDYINENLDKKITLKELADISFMSEPYFSTLFKRYNGITVSEYITIKRVERAIDMLRTTNLTKLEIAEQCGFSSSSNFYKAFHSVTGKTPSEA